MNEAPELKPCPCGEDHEPFVNDGKCEERWIEDMKNACPCCGGSGHKDDVRADLRPVVKPLEWVGDAAAEVWTKAVTQIGTYFICDDTDDFSGFYVKLISHDNAKWWQHVRSTGEMILDCHHDDDLSPLKAAAEADYKARILSALDLAPVTPAQAVDVLLPLVPDDVADELRAIAEGGP